jgi:hypothetical protein
MAIFNSYVSLPEVRCFSLWQADMDMEKPPHDFSPKGIGFSICEFATG